MKNSGGISLSGVNALISGNIFDTLNTSALDMSNARNSMFTNNLFVNIGIANPNNFANIVQDATCRANIFSGNTFDWKGDETWVRTIKIEGTANNHVIKNNVFRNYMEAITTSEVDIIEGNSNVLK